MSKKLQATSKSPNAKKGKKVGSHIVDRNAASGKSDFTHKGRVGQKGNNPTLKDNLSASNKAHRALKNRMHPDIPAPFETKLRKTGSAVGATIPAEFLRHLELKAGDKVTVNVEEDGVKIVKSDPEFDADMAHYDIIEDRFASAFRELAK